MSMAYHDTGTVNSSDRVNFVPPHTGPEIFPNSPLFSRLLRFAHQKPPRLVVRDDRLGVEKTHIQLLTDVLALRTALRAILPPAILSNVDSGVETYIGVLAAGGYEYAVAVLAVLALGAAVVPMSECAKCPNFLPGTFPILMFIQARHYLLKKRLTTSRSPARSHFSLRLPHKSWA